jgi:hypothetical protein
MRKTVLLSAACLSVGAAAFAIAQTAPESTAPSNTDIMAPGQGDHAASPGPASRDQGPPAGAATTGGAPVSADTLTPKPGDHAASPEPATRDQGPAAGTATTGKTTNEPRTRSTEPESRGSAASGPASGKHGTVRRGAGETGAARSSSDVNHSRYYRSGTNRLHAIPLANARHSPPSDENASADQFLQDAQTALREHDTAEAQEALERAETRLLQTTASDTSQSQRVAAVEHAREALGHRRYLRADMTQAGQMIDQALSQSATFGTAPVSPGSQLVPASRERDSPTSD